MSIAVAALAELQRRDQERAAIAAALKQGWEATTSRRDRVRREAVYDQVAAAVGKKVQTNAWRILVKQAVRALGGLPLIPQNRHVFAQLKAREAAAEWAPPRRMSAQAVGQLRRKWYMRLREEGFEDVEVTQGSLRRDPATDGNLRRDHAARADDDPSWYQTRAEINTAFFEKRTEFYWRMCSQLQVWGLYVLEGLDLREVAKRTGLGRDKVHRIVRAMDRLMAANAGSGQRGLIEETSPDAEETAPAEDGPARRETDADTEAA